MKSKIAYESHFGNNPAINRMLAPTDNPYTFSDGNTGTHHMGSYGNLAIPHIQNVDGTLQYTGPRIDEAIKFYGPRAVEDATYFAKHYKNVSPAFQKQNGGTRYETFEDIPTELYSNANDPFSQQYYTTQQELHGDKYSLKPSILERVRGTTLGTNK